MLWVFLRESPNSSRKCFLSMKPGSTLLNHKDPGCHFLRQDSLWLTTLGESSFPLSTHEPGCALLSVRFGLICCGGSVRTFLTGVEERVVGTQWRVSAGRKVWGPRSPEVHPCNHYTSLGPEPGLWSLISGPRLQFCHLSAV